ncbi:Hypothetical protein Nlim_1968 [Candidatus Nitrosarchaeum limnium SFB1]|uniref:Uncharacterized protein n=1 Tax=Candidatus Nitrosarchaeum limnium SFB1 TaxID=886738 RepID=F3KNI6_9ARCH|nr:Hypothetical protein Nlim_1968 [Candidatus Nitrosarchaeum limnium SFB1]
MIKRIYGSCSLMNQRGGEVRLFRTRSSRRAHNPQFSSSNLLPATFHIQKTTNLIHQI